jgi:hypothetical protein
MSRGATSRLVSAPGFRVRTLPVVLSPFVRRASPWFAALALSLSLAACEEAPVGARCESVNDCDRTGAGTTRGCFSFSNPNQPCPGGGASCVCCPVTAMRVPGSTPPVCIGTGSPVTDAGAAQDGGGPSTDGGTDDAAIRD